MYYVLTKDEYGPGWELEECDGLNAVREAVLAGVRGNKEILVALPVEFQIEVKVKEGPMAPSVQGAAKKAAAKKSPKEATDVETTESGPEDDQGPGAESNGSV